MATLSSWFAPQFFTDAGAPAAGYLLDTFDSGTTTPKTTYTNEAGTIANANPIVLDAAGRCTLFLGSGQYTLRLRTPLGATVWTRDDVEGVPSAATTPYLPLAGGTMTGAITLPGNATANLHAAPLQQVNSLIATSAASVTASLTSQINTAADFTQVLTTAVAGDYTTLRTGLGFAQTLGTAGSQTLPGGLILKWGTTAVISTDGTLAVTFPVAFPSACYQVQVTAQGTTTTNFEQYSVAAGGITASGFTIANDGVSLAVFWFAIGS